MHVPDRYPCWHWNFVLHYSIWYWKFCFACTKNVDIVRSFIYNLIDEGFRIWQSVSMICFVSFFLSNPFAPYINEYNMYYSSLGNYFIHIAYMSKLSFIFLFFFSTITIWKSSTVISWLILEICFACIIKISLELCFPL